MAKPGTKGTFSFSTVETEDVLSVPGFHLSRKFLFSANRSRAALYRSREQTWLFKSASRPGRALTIGEGSTLSDFDDVAVRIADVAAYLAVLGYWRGEELRSSTFP